MKKLLLYVCALVLALLPIMTAGADLIHLNGDATKNGIYIYYIPATRDNNRITTAKYIAQSIAASQPETPASYGKYNGKSFNKLNEIFANGNSDGTGAINARLIPQQPESQVCDYWFIVPEEAVNNFIHNSELMNQCRSLLANEDSRAHVVLISDRAVAVPDDSALGALCAEGKTDRIQVSSVFSATELPSSSYEDRDIHTGNFFIAALFGQPADIPYTLSEDGMTRRFTMPETGKALVLSRSLNGAGNTECVDATGNPCEKKDYEISLPKNIAYTGTLLPKLAGGSEYSVTCQSGAIDSISIYWYPNLSEIKPEVVQGGPWSRGENSIDLTLGNDLGRPEDFVVQFDYQVNDGSAAQVSAEYNAERKLWAKSVTTDTSTETITVNPSVRLHMKDGNKIWEWKGERVVFDVISEGVKKSSQAPENLTLWYDPAGKAYGKTSFTWSDFFTYNPEDHPEFSFELAGESCVRCEKTENGIVLVASEGEELPESCVLRLVATLPNEGTDYNLEIRRADIAEIWNAIVISADKEGKDVPVGEKGEIRVGAEIPPETLKRLQEAIAQNVIPFPADSLILACRSDAQGEQTAQLTVNEENEDMKAELTVGIPENMPAGSSSLHAEIRAIDQEMALIGKDISFKVVNNPPEMIRSQAVDDEIRMDGFPWAYTKEENLLAKVFGTDKLFDLFSDPETDLVSATVKVNNALQEEIFSETVHNAEDQTEIAISEPGEYEIILTAYDGVNESEPHVQKIRVYSIIMRIVSYAAAALAAILLILTIILIIRQIRKPSFEGIKVRAFVSSDEDENTAIEVLNKCRPVSLADFRKSKVSLTTVLLLCRQPELNSENMAAANDITLLPTKHSEISILFGKEAQKLIGRSEKKELLAKGNTYRIRMGNTYIEIENVQS